MKKIYTKLIALLMALMMMLGTVAVLAEGGDTTGVAGMVNPWTEYSSVEALQADYPSFEIDELPKNAENVTYAVLDTEEYVMFEVRFTLDGTDYTYRIRPSEAALADPTEMSGLYYTWDQNKSGKQNFNGIAYPFVKQYNSVERVANVYLYDPEAKISYDLSASNVDFVTVTDVADVMFSGEVQVTIVSGSVLSYENGELKILTDNLQTIVFHFIPDEEIGRGDYINVSYVGAFSTKGEPTVAQIEIVDKAETFSGTVTKHDKDYVQVDSGNGSSIRFMLADYTILSGEEKEIKNNATVTVTYSGDISEYPTAFEVYTEVKGDELPERLIDKTLTGTVVKLNKNSITILTEKGKKWTFNRTADTEYPKGKAKLTVDCTVKITYDGYASSKPDAKKIQVTKAPDPKPKYHDVTGIVQSVNGIWIVLDDGKTYTVNGANCKITGQDFLVPGALAILRYYKDGNDRICVKAEFQLRVF